MAADDVDPAPSEFLVEYAEHLPAAGRALDLACGRGRNAVWIAVRGLSRGRRSTSRRSRSRRRGRSPSATASRTGSARSSADLSEGLPPLTGPYDVVICLHYRDPALWPALPELVAPGGFSCRDARAARLEPRPQPRPPRRAGRTARGGRRLAVEFHGRAARRQACVRSTLRAPRSLASRSRDGRRPPPRSRRHDPRRTHGVPRRRRRSRFAATRSSAGSGRSSPRVRRDDEPARAAARAELATRAVIGCLTIAEVQTSSPTARASSGSSRATGSHRDRADPRRSRSRSASRRRSGARSTARSARPRRWASSATSTPARSSTRSIPRARGCSPRSIRTRSPDLEPRLHGHGRAAAQLRQPDQVAADPDQRQGRQARAAPDHGLDLGLGARSSRSSARRPCGPTSRSRSTPRTTRCATRSCRSTASGTSASLLAALKAYPARAARADHVRVRAARRRQRLALRRRELARRFAAASARSTSSRGTRTPGRSSSGPTDAAVRRSRGASRIAASPAWSGRRAAATSPRRADNSR